MTRAYLRLDPGFYERKIIRQGYPAAVAMTLIGVLCLAESQSERGRFRDERLLRALLGDLGRHVPELIRRGDVVTLEDGRVYPDGWDEWQEGDCPVGERMRRVKARRGDAERSAGAQRTATWRLRTKVFERDGYACRYCGTADYPREWLVLEHVDPSGPTDEANLVTACRGCNKRKGGRTPEQAGMDLRDAPVTHHGKRHETGRVTRHWNGLRDVSPNTSRPSDGGRPAESLTPELGTAGHSGAGHSGNLYEENPSRATIEALRADIGAIVERWGRITLKQRAILEEVLERHDTSGPEWAAAIIRETPADADPLAAVMAADRAWQTEQRARIDMEETAWTAEKEADRAAAQDAYEYWFDAVTADPTPHAREAG